MVLVLQPENWRWGGGWREIQREIERERDAFTPYAKEITPFPLSLRAGSWSEGEVAGSSLFVGNNG